MKANQMHIHALVNSMIPMNDARDKGIRKGAIYRRVEKV